MKPAYSILIPAYNRREFLKKAVDSVLAQTVNDFELIVLDDGSSDGTKELMAGYADARLKYFYQENHGVAHARNRALEKAGGQWAAFLDSDDWWLPNKLEVFSDFIRRYPDVRIFHSEERWFRNGRIHNPKKKHQKPDGRAYADILPVCCISLSTAVIHQSVFAAAGVFDENMEACEDYDFFLRATQQFEVKLIPEFLTEKDGGRPDQLSLNVWGQDRFRIRALDKMLTSGRLEKEDYQLTLDELCTKCRIFIEGAQKRGRDVGEYCFLLEKYNGKPALL